MACLWVSTHVANSFNTFVALLSTHFSVSVSPLYCCTGQPRTGPSRCVSPVTRPVGNTPPNAGQKAVGLFFLEGALLAQVVLLSTRILRAFSAKLLPSCWIPVLGREVIPLYLKGFAFLFVGHHEILVDPFLPLPKVPINLNPGL